ncbi:outer membrane beta-barrel protein [Formosa sp. PL04]|uniref:outer membrane beta-barrel protein n=1 Tax=Formosa sp. PL04 TaxID=3081755 RepID=UPI0029828FA2|nr:outer membrane beta-barrel protein [Formosa sp. PL04]MDW5288338.1 tRNA modification GTPase [Formosa sp. PL04]
MKTYLLLFFTTILSINCFSQIAFEKGYFINNANQKTECLIKNVDWLNNPTEIKYMLSDHGETQDISIEDIQEFGIYNVSEYQKETVDIDRSTSSLTDLTSDRNPTFKSEYLLLRVLVKGNATLYEYIEDGKLKRYFYSLNDSKIEQLVFKNYELPNSKLGENNMYRQQLWDNLKCSTIKKDKMQYVEYEREDLVKFFVKYNTCENQDFVNYVEKQKKDIFNFTIRPGINSSSLSIQNNSFEYLDTDFGNTVSFRFGVEVENFLPMNRNKWAIIVEPTYQYFKSDMEIEDYKVDVDYSSIELPVGVRHYFNLNENSQLFVNVSYVFDFSGNSVINFDSGRELEINTTNDFAFGGGYKFNKKYSLEVRYLFSRDVLNSYDLWYSDYKTLSVIFGYTL